MARTPRAGRTGTPAGMQGVRPGSAAAIAAGYVPPGRRRPTRRPGGAPFTPSFNADGTTTLTAPKTATVDVTSGTIPPATSTAAAPPAFVPTSSWWSQQFTADPRYMTSAPVLEGRRTQIGQAYGFTIARNAQGLPLYKTAGGATGITQGFDDKGAVIYKDEQGNTYKPSELQLDIRRVGRGEAGYLEGAFGGAEAGSEKRQFEIGDVAAQAGVRRSGMRGQAGLAETAALQAAIAGLTGRSAAELAGVETDYAQLYREIYGDLVKKAEELAAAQPTAETPAEAPAPEAAPPAAPSGTTPLPGGGSVDPAGNYYPPQPTPDNPKPPLSAGPSGSFTMTVDEIIRVTGRPGGSTPAQMIRSLLDLPNKYTLTKQQRDRIDALVKDIRANPWKYTAGGRPPAGGGGGGGGGGGAPAAGGGGGGAASVPRPTGAGRMYERRGPWQYLGRERGWVKVA